MSASIQTLLALIADFAGGNPAQYMIEKAFAHHKLDWRYLSFEIKPEKLSESVQAVRTLGFFGGHCEGTHQEAIAPSLDRLTDVAAQVGAVNEFFRENDQFVGDYDFGASALASLRERIDPTGKRFLLLGSDKRAHALALALADASAGSVAVADADESRAAELVAKLSAKKADLFSSQKAAEKFVIPEDADVFILVAKTSDETTEILASIDWEFVRPELFVVDLSCDLPKTDLLSAASAVGCKTLDGLTVLIERIAAAFKKWTGVDPAREVLRDAVEEYFEV